MNKVANNKVMVKYGKSSQALFSHKKSFIDENDYLLKKIIKINKFYSAQPKRIKCKNCDYKLGEPIFKKLHVSYCFCDNCEHLNGMYQDTDEFIKMVYTKDKGASYAELYSSKNIDLFIKRTDDIYVPKAEFLKDALIHRNIDPYGLSYADIGAGSGFFVSALKKIGFTNLVGYEVSEMMVDLGNTLIGENLLVELEIDKTHELINSIDAEVVSMIGVLEHLQYPRKILSSIKNNSKIKYLYISVPLFSLSVVFEMVFPNVMHRQLSAAHTHLYTESSLEYMAKEFGLDLIASWWFGTEMMDMWRSIVITLDQQEDTKQMTNIFTDMFSNLIDTLQIDLDKKHLSSEVHMIFSLNND